MDRAGDEGNLMLVSGVVIVLAFILTAITLSQISSLEKEAAASMTPVGVKAWDFYHAQVTSNVKTAVRPELHNDSIRDVALQAVSETFRNNAGGQGFDLVLRLAAEGKGFNHTEKRLLTGTNYDAVTFDGKYTINAPYDGTDDGIIWTKPCPDASVAPGGCAIAVYVYLQLSDPMTARIDEHILIAVNRT